MTMQTVIWVLVFAAGGAAYFVDAGTGRWLRCVFFHASTGLLALGALWLVGRLIPISLAVTPFTLAGSVVFGVPGVVAMLVAAIL